MIKSLILVSIILTSVSFSSAFARTSFSISVGSDAVRVNPYDECYYPCYNRYGEAYYCYPTTGEACVLRHQYRYYDEPYVFIDRPVRSNNYYYNYYHGSSHHHHH